MLTAIIPRAMPWARSFWAFSPYLNHLRKSLMTLMTNDLNDHPPDVGRHAPLPGASRWIIRKKGGKMKICKEIGAISEILFVPLHPQIKG